MWLPPIHKLVRALARRVVSFRWRRQNCAVSVTFDDVELRTDAGSSAFRRSSESPASASFESDSGESVSIRADANSIVVTGLRAASYEDTWREGLRYAQQGLDVFSARGLADLHIEEPQFDHIAVWPGKRLPVIRLVGVATLNVTVPPIKGLSPGRMGPRFPSRRAGRAARRRCVAAQLQHHGRTWLVGGESVKRALGCRGASSWPGAPSAASAAGSRPRASPATGANLRTRSFERDRVAARPAHVATGRPHAAGFS